MIRKATHEDVEAIITLIELTQMQFKRDGIDQWQYGYPNRDTIMSDVEARLGYVLVDANEIVGYYYLAVETDPYYDAIYDGKWLNNGMYAIIHRMVVHPNRRRSGYARLLLKWALNHIQSLGCYDLRIDTHPDNSAMNAFLANQGFIECGKVDVADGMRIAYQIALNKEVNV